MAKTRSMDETVSAPERHGLQAGHMPVTAPAPAATSMHTYQAAASSFGKSMRLVLHQLASLLGRLAAREYLVTDVAGAAEAPSNQMEDGR